VDQEQYEQIKLVVRNLIEQNSLATREEVFNQTLDYF